MPRRIALDRIGAAGVVRIRLRRAYSATEAVLSRNADRCRLRIRGRIEAYPAAPCYNGRRRFGVYIKLLRATAWRVVRCNRVRRANACDSGAYLERTS